MQGGGVRKIERVHRPSIPGVGAAWRLIVAGDRFAYVPLAKGDLRNHHPSLVNIRSADTGDLIATAAWAGGRPRAIAMTETRLAVVINQAGAKQIAIFNATTGAQLATYDVSDTIGKWIDMSNAGVLYSTNTTRPRLRLLDPRASGRAPVSAPLGLCASTNHVPGLANESPLTDDPSMRLLPLRGRTLVCTPDVDDSSSSPSALRVMCYYRCPARIRIASTSCSHDPGGYRGAGMPHRMPRVAGASR